MNFQEILQEIESSDTITLFRHAHPDCDALGSQYALKTWLTDNYPDKKVYALGNETTDQSRFPESDIVSDEVIEKSLAVVLDCGNVERVDDGRFQSAARIIKIDHHPNVDPYGTVNLVDDHAAATCEILASIFRELPEKKISSETAEYLYKGLLTDTLCFRTSNTTPHTLEMASYVASFGVRIPELNRELFDRSLEDFRFCSMLRSSIRFIEDKIGYIVLSAEDLRKWHKEAPEARNLIDEIGHIKELQIWAMFTQKELNGQLVYDGSLRSKTVTINDIAARYRGGGHKNASGVKNLSDDDLCSILNDFQERLKETAE